MSVNPLPTEAVEWLASPSMREHHATWHYVRALWNNLSQTEKDSFASRGWTPPRLNPRGGTPDPGAGSDFFFMHRVMIMDLNSLLAQIGDASYPYVAGWSQIPWDHNDPDWPMPPSFQSNVAWAKTQNETTRQQLMVAQRYENDTWLRSVSIDALGSAIENDIHNWMHVHWSALPWYTGAPGQDRNDIRHNYLGSTYSSHVNDIFWKLHGWIDDRISQWESANNTTANFSNGWDGPHHHDHFMTMSDKASEKLSEPLLTAKELSLAETFFIDQKLARE